MGNAQPEVTATVNDWYESFGNDTPVQLTDTEREATKQEIWEKIEPALVVEKRRWVVPLPVKLLSRAAVVIGVICLLFVLADKLRRTAPPAYTVVSTANGERKNITLRDGSHLTLNAGTTLYVYDDFSTTRRVDLVDGEVFFDVHHDTLHPFKIHNNHFTVTVLGTSFNVSAYTGLKKFAVGVVTGKVRVAKDTTTLQVLLKDRQLVYDRQQQTYAVTATNESLLAWREGRVLFNDVSFNEMTVLMKKNFGVDISTNDSHIANTTYTTELFNTMKPEEAVEVLAAIHGLKIKKANNGFLLYQ